MSREIKEEVTKLQNLHFELHILLTDLDKIYFLNQKFQNNFTRKSNAI